eukprot:SAG31_NODE_2593_length_5423_cov_21.402705_5_plen_53_part_00
MELTLPIGDGELRTSGVCWGDHTAALPDERRILAVHGTLDNAASFEALVPKL